MRIAGVASAFPKQYFRQQEITAALKERWAGKLDHPDVLERLLSRVGVEGRHLALPIEGYDGLTSWGKANDAWIEVSEELAEQALCKALSRAGVSAEKLGAIFFVSVTGIASPSIDARLINRMALAYIDQTNSDFRTRLRGWSGRHSARRRLRARLSRSNVPPWSRSSCARLPGSGTISRRRT